MEGGGRNEDGWRKMGREGEEGGELKGRERKGGKEVGRKSYSF